MATINDGTYTLVYKNGEHFTFEVETVSKGKFEGKRIVSYLAGPDNESDYVGFGFVTESGRVALWKRFAGTKTEERAGHLNILFGMPERLESAGMAYALESGRCRRCRRTLTVPASIHAGYGPECIKHVA